MIQDLTGLCIARRPGRLQASFCFCFRCAKPLLLGSSIYRVMPSAQEGPPLGHLCRPCRELYGPGSIGETFLRAGEMTSWGLKSARHKRQNAPGSRVKGVRPVLGQPTLKTGLSQKRQTTPGGEKGCPHSWDIEPPRGEKSLGTCQRCGVKRMFSNYLPGTL